MIFRFLDSTDKNNNFVYSNLYSIRYNKKDIIIETYYYIVKKDIIINSLANNNHYKKINKFRTNIRCTNTINIICTLEILIICELG